MKPGLRALPVAKQGSRIRGIERGRRLVRWRMWSRNACQSRDNSPRRWFDGDKDVILQEHSRPITAESCIVVHSFDESCSDG